MEMINQVSTTTLVTALITVACIALLSLALVGVIYFHFRRVFGLQEQSLTIVREDLSALCNGTLGLGERVAKFDSRLVTMLKRQEHLEMQEAPERSFKQAIKMVRQGADIDELMQDCGLARGEAELVILSKQLDRAM